MNNTPRDTQDPFQARDDRAGLYVFGIILGFILFCLFTSGCALTVRPLNHLYVGSHPFKQCDAPILFATSQAMSIEQERLTVEAFEYWNKVLGFRMFVYADRVPYEPGDPEAEGFVMVGYGRVPDGTALMTGDVVTVERYAYAHVKADPNTGCVTSASIVMSLSEGTNPVDFYNIVVHEAGHVLGLAHNEHSDGVMHAYFLPFGRGEASQAEKTALYELYGDKNSPSYSR